MSVGLRLLWIVLIAIGATFSAGMYLAGLESLSQDDRPLDRHFTASPDS